VNALGIPPRIAFGIALVLALIGAAGIIAGAFSASEWIIVGALLIVAAINWQRARRARDDER
jgi:hypothetical protein